MPDRLDPKIDILPKAQQEIWSSLSPAPRLSFVLYGGTAVALHLGHRVSLDFDFFRSTSLDRDAMNASLAFMRDARFIQEQQNTLVVIATMPSGAGQAVVLRRPRFKQEMQRCRSHRSTTFWQQNSKPFLIALTRRTIATSPQCSQPECRWKERWADSPRCIAGIRHWPCVHWDFSEMVTCLRYPRRTKNRFVLPGTASAKFRTFQ
jgi:Nucleotidyl transferase AbiEii toxin, Type IV TA system